MSGQDSCESGVSRFRCFNSRNLRSELSMMEPRIVAKESATGQVAILQIVVTPGRYRYKSAKLGIFCGAFCFIAHDSMEREKASHPTV